MPGSSSPWAPPPATVAHAPQGGERRSAANDQADRTGTRAPRAASAAEAPAKPAPASASNKSDKSTTPAGPVTTTRTDVETRAIPFRTRLVRDPEMPRGTKRVQTQGVNGEETLRYQVTLVNGQATDRKLLDTTVTREPQNRVVAYGWGRRGGPNRGGNMQGGGFHKDDACGNSLRVCVPLGRKACKNDEESALQLGGSVVVLDKDEGAACARSRDIKKTFQILLLGPFDRFLQFF